MNEVKPKFEFPIIYAGEEVICVAEMNESSYSISFNGKFMGTIVANENGTWMLESGIPMAESTIARIGEKIESQYL